MDLKSWRIFFYVTWEIGLEASFAWLLQYKFFGDFLNFKQPERLHLLVYDQNFYGGRGGGWGRGFAVKDA